MIAALRGATGTPKYFRGFDRFYNRTRRVASRATQVIHTVRVPLTAFWAFISGGIAHALCHGVLLGQVGRGVGHRALRVVMGGRVIQTPLSIFGIPCRESVMKYTKRRLNDFTAHGYLRAEELGEELDVARLARRVSLPLSTDFNLNMRKDNTITAVS